MGTSLPATTMRVTYRVTTQTLAAAICYRAGTTGWDSVPTERRGVLAEVRSYLRYHGEPGCGTFDDIDNVTYERARALAVSLFPELAGDA